MDLQNKYVFKNSAHIHTLIQPTYNQTEKLKIIAWKQPKLYTQQKLLFWINKTNNLSILLLINRRNRKKTLLS